jgi:hypothetical protein
MGIKKFINILDYSTDKSHIFESFFFGYLGSVSKSVSFDIYAYEIPVGKMRG